MRDAAPADEHLVSLSRNGNVEAFNSLVHRYERQVYSLCLRLIGDSTAAEDAAQETFLAAYRGLRGFRGGTFRSWLLRIAANQAKDELRCRARRPALSLTPAEGDEAADLYPADPGHGPAELAETDVIAAGLREGLARLPFEQRQVVLLVDYLGFDYEEAARAADTSLGTVKSRLHRGREALRQFVVARPELFGTRWRREG